MEAAVQSISESRAQGRRVIRPLPQRAVTGLKLLVDRNGDQPSRILTFSKSQTSVVTIGRKAAAANGNDCWPADEAMFRCPVVSRKHAKIAFSDAGTAYLIDLGSHHGTYILKPSDADSRRIKPQTPVTLEDDDVITFGKGVKSGDALVPPVTARVQLLRGTISSSPITYRRASSNAMTPSSTTSPIKRSSSGRFGLQYISSEDEEEEAIVSSEPERDSDVEEVPRPCSQPLEEIVSLSNADGPVAPLSSSRLPSFRAFNVHLPILDQFPTLPMPWNLLKASSRNDSPPIDADITRDDTTPFESPSPFSIVRTPSVHSKAGDENSTSSRPSSPVETSIPPWRQSSLGPDGERDEEGQGRHAMNDESRDMSLSNGDEDMSEDGGSPEDPYVPSFGQSANRYPIIDEDFVEYALPSVLSDMPSPPSEATPEPEVLPITSLDEALWPLAASRSESVEDTSAPAAQSQAAVTTELQTSLATFDKGLKDLKNRLESHMATTRVVLDSHDRRVMDVNELCSSLSTRMDAGGDLPGRVKEVERRMSGFQDDIERNGKKRQEEEKYREELAADLGIVRGLASGDVRQRCGRSTSSCRGSLPLSCALAKMLVWKFPESFNDCRTMLLLWRFGGH
ncbi:hypothetical protein OE88DRAFT_1540511 [Heliocybe sulcata]|uniref:FHA domain-containing protein n=1 Tax=Heliocybe sulcata TaxID=5364 RepID=A0A5C3N1R0_9AGAM|nr:hypothetical protein OE88DRAFT_1540511 [Heliocybe sulcata]